MNSTDRQPFAGHAIRITLVELTWLEGRIEHWIRFGRIAEEHIIDRRHRVVGFPPSSIFAFVRWAANDFGTIISRIDILRATAQDESYTTVPFVRPGGEILLRIHGWPKLRFISAAPPWLWRSCATAWCGPPSTLPSASMRRTPRRITGATSTTV